jgi:CrcB protein
MDWTQAKLFGLVAIGGAFGSVVRYVASGYLTRGDFPWGTFFVNLTGSFLLALLFFLAMGRGFITSELRALVFVGVFGGYTTMSTFSLETVSLLTEGQLAWATGNIFLNAGLCVVGAYLGRAVGILLGGA